MALDPRIILGLRPLASPAEMQDDRDRREINRQEVELRRQDIDLRRQALAQRGLPGQPKPFDPVAEGHAMDYRTKQIVTVSNLLKRAKTDPSSYPQVRSTIGQLVPDAMSHLPEEYDDATISGIIADGDALVAKEVKTGTPQLLEMPDPDDPTKTIRKYVIPRENDVYPGVPKSLTAKASNLGSFEDYVTRTYGENPTSAQILKARKEYNQSDDKATGFAAADVTKLSPAGIEIAALNYKKNGVMPPLGMGDKGNRQAIINRAATLTPADIARIESGGLDIAGNKADYKANADTLTALTKQRAAIGAFEQTAQKNIDVFLKQAEKVTDTGIPLLNAPVRWAAGAGGSQDQAAYQAARLVAINEIAKITSNPTLAGQLSDSARHEVEAFNPQNATLGQTRAVMKLLKQDMQNRTTALDAEIAEVRKRIGSGSTTKTEESDVPRLPGLSYQDYLKSKGRK